MLALAWVAVTAVPMLGAIPHGSRGGHPAAEVPTMLIVYLPVATKDNPNPALSDTDPYSSIPNYLATGLDASGKVKVVVWGMSDPVFREGVLSGKLAVAPDKPNATSIGRAARSLNAELVLQVRLGSEKDRSVAQGELFKSGRSAWTNKQELQVMVAANASPADVCTSLANTWSQMLIAGPLKGYGAQIQVPTPPPDQGQVKPVVIETTPTAEPVSVDALRTRVAELRKEGKLRLAEMEVRRAIDEVPTDAARRELLVAILLEQGEPERAADTALSASAAVPDGAKLRLMAARAYIADGQADRAQLALNEAVARDPNDLQVRQLLGEIALGQGRPDEAIPHLEAAAKGNASASANYWLGLAHGLKGDATLAAKHRAAAVERGFDETTAFGQSVRMLEAQADRDMQATRDLLNLAAANREPDAVRTRRQTLAQGNDARIAWLAGFKPSPATGRMLDRLTLALQLYGQCLETTAEYLDSRSAELLTDARIDLSEALKQLKAIREPVTAVG
ncbi:MAG: tetratricopeptide repeat protein [Fimbriimonadaceae bacterium]|nr:tetratricopeptide repeat protein [Fimbriimonadaceae bacterium]